LKWIAEDDDKLVLFFELSDDQLERVSKDNKFFFDTDFIDECEQTKGCHAHVLRIYSNGDTSFFYKHFKDNSYKSISWWNKTRTKFYIRRQICQH